MVVHCKIDKYDVYIGRPSVWGNPFSHKNGTLAKYKVDTVEQAVDRYREWVMAQPTFVDVIKRELKGQVLGCWCKTANNPYALCHGDVLVKIANQ